MKCHFCSKTYHFTSGELKSIIAEKKRQLKQ
jgi:hypothetical protein